METKKFISTVKGFRTRFTNKPNADLEKKSVESTCEKVGGKLEAMAQLKEAGETELLDYVRKVFGIVRVAESKPAVKKEDAVEIAPGKDGKLYEIDTINKTCKRVFKDLSEIKVEDINVAEMPLTTYLRYLQDKFPGEGAKIKKDKLYFRGYRISCTVDNGFMVEDSTKRYAVVETNFEGIPTPRELGDFFNRPRVEHTPEELAAAIERGKKLAAERKSEKEEVVVEEEPEVDFELLRKKVLRKIKAIRDKKESGFDPMLFPDMIPFKRWKRKSSILLKKWKNRELRYPKLLNELEKLATEETFEIEEKNHRSKFVGAILPTFKTVGRLIGDKIEVDDKLVDAVPFMLDYILHYEPKAMQQVMRYADGEVTAVQLLKDPYHNDWKIEYKKHSVENTSENAQLLSALCASIGLVAPQDLLYTADLQVGDKIMIAEDGEWKTKTITSTDEGICINKGIGLLKLDKWIKLPNKD
jgi:hypothetical protein